MGQKIKIIIIGLIAILAISFFLNLRIYSLKQALEQERDSLKRENQLLGQKVEESLQDNQRLKDRLERVSKDLDAVAKEKDDLKRKFELVGREREELVEKLKTVQKEAQATPAQQPSPVVGDAYWAGILKTKADLELQLQNVRSELKTIQITNGQLQREKNTLELEVSNLSRDKQDLTRQVDYNQKMLDTLSAELVREKNDKIQIQNSLKSIKSENTVLIRQLKTLSSNRASLERKIQKLQEDKSALERRFTEMEIILRENMDRTSLLKEQLDNLRTTGQAQPQTKKESVELPPIVVRPQLEAETTVAGTLQAPVEAASGPVLSGKIMAVNKENNFVIIDLGEEAGIEVGNTFQAYRQDKPIATIEVIQVRKSIAACDIKKEITPIKVGDVVK